MVFVIASNSNSGDCETDDFPFDAEGSDLTRHTYVQDGKTDDGENLQRALHLPRSASTFRAGLVQSPRINEKGPRRSPQAAGAVPPAKSRPSRTRGTA